MCVCVCATVSTVASAPSYVTGSVSVMGLTVSELQLILSDNSSMQQWTTCVSAWLGGGTAVNTDPYAVSLSGFADVSDGTCTPGDGAGGSVTVLGGLTLRFVASVPPSYAGPTTESTAVFGVNLAEAWAATIPTVCGVVNATVSSSSLLQTIHSWFR